MPVLQKRRRLTATAPSPVPDSSRSDREASSSSDGPVRMSALDALASVSAGSSNSNSNSNNSGSGTQFRAFESTASASSYNSPVKMQTDSDADTAAALLALSPALVKPAAARVTMTAALLNTPEGRISPAPTSLGGISHSASVPSSTSTKPRKLQLSANSCFSSTLPSLADSPVKDTANAQKSPKSQPQSAKQSDTEVKAAVAESKPQPDSKRGSAKSKESEESKVVEPSVKPTAAPATDATPMDLSDSNKPVPQTQTQSQPEPAKQEKQDTKLSAPDPISNIDNPLAVLVKQEEEFAAPRPKEPRNRSSHLHPANVPKIEGFVPSALKGATSANDPLDAWTPSSE